MIKILYIIFFSLIVSNCSFKKVVNHHGVPFLEKKQKSLIINKTNKNDIKKILGNPSTTSKFDNDIWIYIERKQTQSELKNLGKIKISKNQLGYKVLLGPFANKSYTARVLSNLKEKGFKDAVIENIY